MLMRTQANGGHTYIVVEYCAGQQNVQRIKSIAGIYQLSS